MGESNIRKSDSKYASYCSTTFIERDAVRHVLGKGGRIIHRIEDYTGCFILLDDICWDGQPRTMVTAFGGESELARFLVFAIAHGHFSALDALARNGVTHI